MDTSDWIDHRRGDRERLGWMRPEGDGFVVIDLLGRELSEPLDWLAAEELLEATGIAYLAEPYLLDRAGSAPLRVRIVEVSTARILVKREDFGDIGATREDNVLDWPMPPQLRPLASDPASAASSEWPFPGERSTATPATPEGES